MLPHRILSMETELMYERWLQESDRLTKDIELFKDYFNQHKKCGCINDRCRHFNKALMKALGDRISKRFSTVVDIGIRVHYDILEGK